MSKVSKSKKSNHLTLDYFFWANLLTKAGDFEASKLMPLSLELTEPLTESVLPFIIFYLPNLNSTQLSFLLICFLSAFLVTNNGELS